MSSIKLKEIAIQQVAEILSKEPVAIDKRQQIYYGLDLESRDFKKINKEAGADSYSFFIAMLELFFGNKDPNSAIGKLITLLNEMNMGYSAELISKLKLNGATKRNPAVYFHNQKSVIPKYKITKNKYGFIGSALIVNFGNFYRRDNREVAKCDTLNLKSLCHELNLCETSKKGLEKYNFFEAVKDFIDEFDENDPEKVCMVVILSYSEDKGSFKTECGSRVSIYHELLPMFNKEESKVKNNPKLFVFVFCHGDEDDYTTNSRTRREQKYDFQDTFCLFSINKPSVPPSRQNEGTFFVESFCRVIREHKEEELRNIVWLIEKEFEKIQGSEQPTSQHYGFNHFYFEAASILSHFKKYKTKK